MTFTELVAHIRSNIGNTNKDSLIETQINVEIRAISRLHGWADMNVVESFPIVANDQSLYLPNIKNLRTVRFINGVNSRYLRQMGVADFHRIYPNVGAESSGELQEYMRLGRWIFFQPKSDGTYTVDVAYVKWPPSISGSQQPLIQGIDDVIVARVTSYIFMSMEEKELGVYWEKVAQMRLPEAIVADIPQDSAPIAITNAKTKTDAYAT